VAPGGGTGTPVSGGFAAGTLADLRARCRAVLTSLTDWPNAKLDGWIGDAIRFYSAEFPRVRLHTLTLTGGTQHYDLPGGRDLQAVVSVEYPAGLEPAQYLYYAARWEPLFRNEGYAYTLRAVTDATATDADDVRTQIEFAQDVSTGETAVVEYQCAHEVPAAGDDACTITVPAAHWEALIAFVDFRGHWELETGKAITVTTNSVVLAQLGENARRAWLRFKEVQRQIGYLEGGKSAIVSWAGIGM